MHPRSVAPYSKKVRRTASAVLRFAQMMRRTLLQRARGAIPPKRRNTLQWCNVRTKHSNAMNINKLFLRRAKRGAIYKSAWGHFVINDKNGAEIIFDKNGLGVTFDGCCVIRVTLMGGGRYTADADIIYKYLRNALRELAECFQSNDDLRVWLETVFQPYEVDGKRYVLRIAKDLISACATCVFSDKNSVCRKTQSLLSCTLEARKHDAKTTCVYFQRID